MKFFDNLFKVNDDNYYGVTGLNSELSMIYVYESFLKYNTLPSLPVRLVTHILLPRVHCLPPVF